MKIRHCRRTWLFIALFCGVCAALLPFSFAAHDRPTLRVLAWEGYADPEVVAAFERATGATVEVTYVASDDDLWGKMTTHGGRDFDVFAVNTAELQRYIDHQLSAPLNPARLVNRAQQLPRFRDYAAIPGLSRDGKTYAAPYTYATMGLIYNRKLVPSPPQSIDALWAPAYRGKVLLYDTSNHNFSLAGQHLRVGDIFRMTPTEMNQAAGALIDLRRNALGFYSTVEEAVDLFQRHDAAILFANFGEQQVKALRDAGADIGYVLPREGALAWLDCWSISAGARDRALAERWIDFTLERQNSERLTNLHGLANTVSAASPANATEKLLWLRPLEDPAQRLRLWRRIVSGVSAVNG